SWRSQLRAVPGQCLRSREQAPFTIRDRRTHTRPRDGSARRTQSRLSVYARFETLTQTQRVGRGRHHSSLMESMTRTPGPTAPWRLVDGYQVRNGHVHDELITPGGELRPHYDTFVR